MLMILNVQRCSDVCSLPVCVNIANQTFDVDSDVNDTTDLIVSLIQPLNSSADAALMPVVPNDAEQPPTDASNFTGTDVLDSTFESVDASIQSSDTP